MTSATRLRLLIASANPPISGYDQEEFARTLYYTDRPIDASLDAFNAARRSTAEILDRLTEAEWLREGTHTEHGRYTVHKWLELYAAHAHGHAQQILVARDAAKQARGKQGRDLRSRAPSGAPERADLKVGSYVSELSRRSRPSRPSRPSRSENSAAAR